MNKLLLATVALTVVSSAHADERPTFPQFPENNLVCEQEHQENRSLISIRPADWTVVVRPIWGWGPHRDEQRYPIKKINIDERAGRDIFGHEYKFRLWYIRELGFGPNNEYAF